jgi:hypothetical protein
MRHIIYSMQFKGSATPGSDKGVLKATTSATSASMKTVVGPDGVEGSFIPAEGGMAFFESEVRMTGPQHFTESGSIAFGEGDHALNFSTVGQGELIPSADPKEMSGAVTWKVDSGEGQFQGATGYITSNFLVSDQGEVTDYHFGLIFLK